MRPARYRASGNPIRPPIAELRRWAKAELDPLTDEQLLAKIQELRAQQLDYHVKVARFTYHKRIVEALSHIFPDD